MHHSYPLPAKADAYHKIPLQLLNQRDQDTFWVKKMREKVSKIEIEKQHWIEVIKDLKRAYHLKITTFDSLSIKRNRCKEHNND